MSNVNIRPFEPTDRAAIRTIACDAADKGEPIERIFFDRECAADLLTAYYTDYEPDAVFVATVDNRVVGYVLGGLDNRRYGLVLFWILVPKFIFKAFTRGVFFRRETWQLLTGAARNWRRLFTWRKQSFHSHQAHLHLSVAKDFRGHQVGRQLVLALLDYAKVRHVQEMTASVHSDNQAGREFFEHLGFRVAERHAMVMAAGSTFINYDSLLYAKSLL